MEEHAYEGARLLDRLMDGASPPRRPLRVAHKGVVIRQSSDVLAIEHPGLARAIHRIWRDYADPSLSVERLAAEASMTRRGLNKACRKHRGQTVSAELKRIRLAKATELIAASGGRPKVATIARQCGSSSAKHLRGDPVTGFHFACRPRWVPAETGCFEDEDEDENEDDRDRRPLRSIQTRSSAIRAWDSGRAGPF